MKSLRFLSASLILLSFFAPLALAQAAPAQPKITIKVPTTLQLDQDSTVAIEVTDADGKPFADGLPTVTFSPEAGVSDDVLFDCSDVNDSDSCDANDRGVAGVFESVFTLKKSPVTMTVEVDGVSQQAQLVVTQGEAAPAVASPAVPAAQAADKSVLSPAAVKVGPYPSVWIILLPLAVMMAVVTVFVVKTTE